MAVNENDPAGTPLDARIAALYREAALEAPPAHLDSQILRDARLGLALPHTAPARPWWTMWRMPVAFAAVAVLGVSVVTVISREGGEPLSIGEPAPTAPPAQVEHAPRLPEVTAAIPAAPPPPAQVERGTVGALRKDDRRPQSAAPPDRAAAATREPASPPVAAAAADAATAGALHSRSAPNPASAEMASQPHLPGAEPAPYALSAPRPAPVPAAAPQASPPRASAKADAPEAKEEPAAAQRSVAPAPAARPAIRARDALTAAVAALVAELEGRAPAEWFQRVVLLRRDGREADADALLAEFRRRYPQESIPDAVK